MNSLEKAAYLRGLAEGQGISADTKDGRLTLAIIDAIDSLAQELSALHEETHELAEGVSGLDEAYDELSEILYDLAEDSDVDDDDDDKDEDDECGDDCDCCDGDCDDSLEYETDCPKCGENLTLTEDDLAAGFIVCPKCGEKLEFEFGEFGDEAEDEED
ncbi:MAG: TFIIB-type zinc ribbon-containing protein [Oscillospiraceae bacterium]|jgi:hypothetical protein|nr:TFIIB-type zinc ribbon-containing protein [Oscillospiraceae bacterium]